MCCCEELQRRLHLGILKLLPVQDLVSFGLPMTFSNFARGLSPQRCWEQAPCVRAAKPTVFGQALGFERDGTEQLRKPECVMS